MGTQISHSPDSPGDDPDTTDRTVRFVANDGVLNSNNGDVTVTVTADNDPPTLTAPGAYASTGNVGIDVPAASGLLTAATIGDPDFAGPFTVGGTVPTGTSGLGTVSINTSTGAFTYTPAAGFTGADTFNYQVCDNGTPLPSECSTAQMVTINVGDMIWFIDNSLGAAGNGTLATPFNTLAGFEALNGNGGSDPGAGDCIFVDTGSGDYTGGVTLENTQILVGEGASAGLAGVCGITVPPFSNPLPNTGGISPTVINTTGDGITLVSDNTIRGLDIGNTSGTGMRGNNVGTVTVSDTSISGTGGGIDITTGNLAVTFDSLSASSSSDEGIRLNNVSGSFSITGTSGTISTTGVPAIDITGTPLNVGLTFQSVSASGATSGIVLDNTTGSFTVTGTGTTDGSGGTMATITDRGVSLIDSENISLNNMTFSSASTTNGSTCTGTDNSGCNAAIHLHNSSSIDLANIDIGSSAQQGINGLNVTGFTLTNSTVSGCGDEVNEGCLRLVNLSGTASITNSDLAFAAERVAQIENTDTTLDLTVSGSTFRDTQSSGIGADGLEIISNGSSSTTIDISTKHFPQLN